MSEEVNEEKQDKPVYRDGAYLVMNDPNFMGPPMKYSMIGARVESGGDPNKPVYDANVDIVNIMPFALERVIYMLVSKTNCPLVDEIVNMHNVKYKDLYETYDAFCTTMDLFTGPDARSTIDEAAKASGYTDRPAVEKILVEAMLGRFMLGAYWFGIRNRTAKSERPTIPVAYDRWPIIMREIRCAMDGIETPYAKKIKEKFGVKLNDSCTPLNYDEEDDI